MSLLRFSFQNETLILDDLLYLYNVNAVRFSYLYKSSLGVREAQKKTKKDVNTCFYRLNYRACKRGINFISFRNETHFEIMLKVPQGRTIRFLREGGGTFANCTMFLLSLRLCSIFQGVNAQHPPSPLNQKSNGPSLRCYQVL